MPTALIPPSCAGGSPGVLRDQSLEKQQAQVKRCRHPARSGSPAWGLTYLFLGLQVKVWRLPESGQDMPSNAGLTMGPGGGPVDMLQFHPTADGVLASGAGKRVTIWDVAQQQPLTGKHGPACRLLPVTCISTTLVPGLKQQAQVWTLVSLSRQHGWLLGQGAPQPLTRVQGPADVAV